MSAPNALTNPQAALMAAISAEKHSIHEYRRAGQMEAVVLRRADEFLRFLEARTPATPAERPTGRDA